MLFAVYPLFFQCAARYQFIKQLTTNPMLVSALTLRAYFVTTGTKSIDMNIDMMITFGSNYVQL